MDVYVAIVEDRHVDAEAHVFSTLDLARDWARTAAAEWATRVQDITEKEPREADWLFAVEYSIEGDWIRVVKATIDEVALSRG